MTDAEQQLTNLKAFAVEIMQREWDSGVFNGEAQELAEKHGLILPQMMSEPCGQGCRCEEEYGCDFPVRCYQLAPFLKEITTQWLTPRRKTRRRTRRQSSRSSA